jgi:glycosyltransferase involved in cell wall biosynthesis
MRVLLQIRPDYLDRPGGDATQARRTAEELRALGIEADLRGGVAPDLAGYDLVHIFNTQEIDDSVRQAIRARGWGLPVVLSPIYWQPAPFVTGTVASGAPLVDDPAQRAKQALQRLTLGAAQLLLPNSEAEAAQIADIFPGLHAAVRIVPNAVDPRFAQGDGARFCTRYDLAARGFVLCAGRKEALKNQLGLIRACAALDLPLVLAGQELAAAANYLAECHAAAEASRAPVLFLPDLAADELADAYAAARVHVQASFYETVGLSSLEATLGGANIVVTANSGVREYLGESAWYCDPTSPGSLFAALAAAWSAPLRADSGHDLAERYSWRRAAEVTARGYEEVLQMERPTTNTRWLPDLPTDDYVAHLEDLIQIQLEATAFRDQQYGVLQEEHRDLYMQFRKATENGAALSAGLAAEAAERGRTEEAFRTLEAHAKAQGEYIAKLEAELAARPAAPAGRRPWQRS